MSWQNIIKANFYEEYNMENAASQSRFAEDSADSLGGMGDWYEMFDKSFQEFQRMALEYSGDSPARREIEDKLSSIKKIALEEWEQAIIIGVRMIEKYGSDRDKDKLKANRYWMKGTIRSADEFYSSKKKE